MNRNVIAQIIVFKQNVPENDIETSSSAQAIIINCFIVDRKGLGTIFASFIGSKLGNWSNVIAESFFNQLTATKSDAITRCIAFWLMESFHLYWQTHFQSTLNFSPGSGNVS